jgi:hypothetical protein
MNGICQIDNTCKCKPGFAGKDCSEYTTVGNDISINYDDPFKALAVVGAKLTAETTKIQEITKLDKKLSLDYKQCFNDCSGHGKCNNITGQCMCEKGYNGKDCGLINNKSDKITKRINKKMEDKEPEDKSDDDKSDDDKSDDDKSTGNIKSENKSDDDKTEDKSKLENAYIVGVNKDVYYKTEDCTNKCSSKGMCLNSTCFCEQGFTSYDCSMTYKQFLVQGFLFNDMVKFFIITFFISMIATLAVLIHKSNQKVSGDNLDLDN